MMYMIDLSLIKIKSFIKVKKICLIFELSAFLQIEKRRFISWFVAEENGLMPVYNLF